MVRKDSFQFGGVDMLAVYGVRAVAHDVLVPRMRPRLLSIPGRDGSYDFGTGAYEDRLVRIACDSRKALSRQTLRELALLLSRKGRLVLWDEPEKYYVGRLYDDTALRYIGRIGHEFDLTFVCEPFAYGPGVEKAAPGAVGYEGTARTPGVLTLTNTGTTTISTVRIVIRRLA